MNDAIIVEKHEDGYKVTCETSRKELLVGAINGRFTLELTKEQAKLLSNALYTPKPFVPKAKKEVETTMSAIETIAEVKKTKRAPRKKAVTAEKTGETAVASAPAKKYMPRAPKADK